MYLAVDYSGVQTMKPDLKITEILSWGELPDLSHLAESERAYFLEFDRLLRIAIDPKTPSKEASEAGMKALEMYIISQTGETVVN